MDEVKFFEYFVGPQHPGVTGNFSVHLKARGDVILEAKASPGYLHRGFEKLMEQRTWLQNITIVCRICVPDPDPVEALYSMGVEELMGVQPPERAQYIRAMVLEMSRISAHLLYLGSIAGAAGLYTIPNWAVGDRDYLLDRFEELTGGRVYHIYMIPGGVRRDLPRGFKKRLAETLDYIEGRLPEYERLLFDNWVFKERAVGIGVIEPEWGLKMGVSGPNIRASGVAWDIRREDPYLVYDKLEFEIPVGERGDVYDRALMRYLEIYQSINIIRQILEAIPEEGEFREDLGNPFEWTAPPGDAFVRVESSKGEFGMYLVSDGGKKPRRIQVRGPSYTHGITVLEEMLKGVRIEDVPMILFSLDVCPPDIER